MAGLWPCFSFGAKPNALSAAVARKTAPKVPKHFNKQLILLAFAANERRHQSVYGYQTLDVDHVTGGIDHH
jgi:hypothetical protein